MSPEEFAAKWSAEAEAMRQRAALVNGAALLEEVLQDFDSAVGDYWHQALTLTEASWESGYSPDHLGLLIRQGTIPNAGRPEPQTCRRNTQADRAGCRHSREGAMTMSQAKKRWSYCTGERGRNRVRAFEHAESGRLFLEFADHGRKARVALRHADRSAARAKAEELAAALRSDSAPARAAILRMLFDIYVREVSPGKGPSAQRHDRAAVRRFQEFLGPTRRPETLNRRDWDGFIRWRRERGDERARREDKKRPVGNRVIEQDLKFLHAVLNWATLARDDSGVPLLERNPLKGLPWPKHLSPRRVMLTGEDYEAMRQVAGRVSVLFELALALAHETGHRIGSIRLLKWSDLDLEAGRIRWRAENDKIGFEHGTFLTTAVLEALAKARSDRPSIGDTWLFPALSNPAVPCSRHIFRDWWERAQELAGLPGEPGRGWHSLRRKFATDLKHVPLRDLCYLGGWKEPQTVLKCYQQPDEATMRQALAGRGRRGESTPESTPQAQSR